MFERLKSLPLTILLTILIWMYAEAQFVATRSEVRLNVEIQSPSPDLALRVFDGDRAVYVPGSVVPVIVTMQGPQNQIDSVYQASLKLQPNEPMEGLSFTLKSSDLQVNGSVGAIKSTVAILNNLDYFKTKGITVTAASPAQIRIDVNQVVQTTAENVPIFVSGPPEVLAKYDVVLDPKTVSIRVAGSQSRIDALAAKLKAGGAVAANEAGVFAYVDLPADAAANPNGRHAIRYVLPEGLIRVAAPGDAGYQLVAK